MTPEELQRLEAVEQQLEIITDFSVVDPQSASMLLGFWLASFITAHVVGRVARALGKY